MPTYKTPGVYVEEISTLPPSVAEVATAIPAFIGYTAKGKAGAVEIAEVSTLLEYELRFGKAPATAFRTDAAGNVTAPAALPEWLLWYAINLYFKNGGGRCYVVSVDNHAAELDKARFEAGLTELEREDEPTLIVMPEAVALDQTDFDDLNQQALALCAKLADRFAILDVKDGDVANSRTGYGSDNLAYGAAYHPYLSTSINFVYDEATVQIGAGDSAPTLASLKSTNTSLYNQIKKNLADQRVTLPASPAVAGIYARVDRERGVWKAPANVGVMSVIGPSTQITHEQQENLNVDATTGKSINAIRAFAGRGTLVWGARTLAGNDNEWRYVPVRRLFIMIEESAKKASAFAVFEPNDATTWLKVKGMIESYLYGLWEQGALQGAKPDDAYYVNVGLGKTMSAQDVLEGRMNVEIGIAAVRPAEFIVLRFSHKLAEA
ncbi:phage tail sheath family protein [Nannocystaceae bacterium ST9]